MIVAGSTDEFSWVKRRNDGEGWQATQRLRAPNPEAALVDVVLDDEGDATALWTDVSQYGWTSAYSSSQESSGEWLDAVRIVGAETKLNPLETELIVDLRGRHFLVGVWGCHFGCGNLFVSQRSRGVWTRPLTIAWETANVWIDYPDFASNGNLAAVSYTRLSKSGDRRDLLVATGSSRSRWARARVIDDGATRSSIAMTTYGELAVVYDSWPDEQALVERFRGAGGRWHRARVVSRPVAAEFGVAFEVESDRAGLLTVFWTLRRRNEIYSLYTSERTTRSWYSIVELHSNYADLIGDDHLAVGESGQAVLAWVQPNRDALFSRVRGFD